jgi:hypothetical protein
MTLIVCRGGAIGPAGVLWHARPQSLGLYVALIVCAAVAIVALSAGSTFATLVWARRYFLEALGYRNY